jgi:pyridoxine 4-dehydrogenase
MVERQGGRSHATPAQVALAWLLQHSPNVVPIPGTASRAHLEENVAAAALSLSADDCDQLTKT